MDYFFGRQFFDGQGSCPSLVVSQAIQQAHLSSNLILCQFLYTFFRSNGEQLFSRVQNPFFSFLLIETFQKMRRVLCSLCHVLAEPCLDLPFHGQDQPSRRLENLVFSLGSLCRLLYPFSIEEQYLLQIWNANFFLLIEQNRNLRLLDLRCNSRNLYLPRLNHNTFNHVIKYKTFTYAGGMDHHGLD